MGNDRTPYSKFSMPSSSASAPPETSAPTAPSRGSIDVNQSAPSQPQAQNQPSYSPMVQQILDYQKQLAALPDPTAVAKAQTAKRGLGTKILDTLGGVLAGVQQGGIIGGLSGGIGGARGTLRRQAIEAKQQAENDRARANILQQYGITQAAAKQMDDEAKNQVAAQTAKQTGEKNAWEQKHQQMLYDLEVQKAKVEALYKDGQLTNQQRTDSLKELENATTALKTYQGTGQPLPDVFTKPLRLPSGYIVNAKEPNSKQQTITDENGNVFAYDENSQDPSKTLKPLGIKQKVAFDPHSEASDTEITNRATNDALTEYNKQYPNGRPNKWTMKQKPSCSANG